ncbi:MAG: TOBE domain-containing protein [Desulfobulbaceae bacterium]|nr:TOBE domain-containing protein [Desulfobulbaceae bacterium]
MNLVPAIVRHEKKTTFLDFVSAEGEEKISLKLKANLSALNSHIGKKIIVGMRPEALGAQSSVKSDFSVVVSSTEHAGSDVFAEFELGGMRATARLAGRTKIGVGDTLNLTIEPDDICYFDPESELAIR